jgi:hypothetical protein
MSHQLVQSRPVPRLVDRAELYAIVLGTAERQELLLSRQLKELHRLVAKQRQLHGKDPLTGAVVHRPKKIADPFEEKLLPLLDEQGGISGIENVESVLTLMRQASSVDSSRKLLLLVLDKTRDKMPCLAKFVKAQGLGVLSSWLSDASKAAKPQLVLKILRLLPRLPVTVNGLRDSGIGKLVNRLTKTKADVGETREDIKKEAASVVEGWKALAKANVSSASATTVAVPRRDAEPLAKKNKLNKASLSSSNKHHSGGSDGKTSAAARNEPREKQDVDKKPAARRTATVIRESDMFGAGAAAGSSQKKPRTVRRPSPTEGHRQAKPPAAGRPKSPTSSSPFSSSAGRASPRHTVVKADAAAGSAATAAGNKRPHADMTSDRIAARDVAPSKMPRVADEPSSANPKKRGKRVTWPSDDKIARWKYFTKDEPAAIKQVGGSCFLSAQASSHLGSCLLLHLRYGAAQAAPGFQSALQEEKAAERRAMAARIREQKEKLSMVQERVAWSEPTPLALPSGCKEVAATYGQDSEERFTQANREKLALEAFYSTQNTPASPAEPVNADDRASTEPDDATTLVIPLVDGQQHMPTQLEALAAPAAPQSEWAATAAPQQQRQSSGAASQVSLLTRCVCTEMSESRSEPALLLQLSSLVDQITSLQTTMAQRMSQAGGLQQQQQQQQQQQHMHR